MLSGVVIALFVLFFFLKEGNGMWRAVVAVGPAAHRDRLEAAGRQGWETLSRYVRGVVVIAVSDAVLTAVALRTDEASREPDPES
ncbi:hypothetical protein GCM10023200_24300 [Actinomycetospora chlora]|uniref:Uncharacterized protein n=1 Tax=Actinomycetospora chlora TaxID=663608 RepID=A0ABP9B0N7_9PSEU